MHTISDELLSEIQTALQNKEHWIAYNTLSYFLDKGDMYFFKDRDEAVEFSGNNISDDDRYRVITAQSFQDVYHQIPFEQDFSLQKSNNMNEQNFEYLKDNLKYMGFGESLGEELKNQLQLAPAQFQLQYATEINKKPFSATLNFRKSDQSGMYFFNSYHAALTRSNGETKDQTFYLNKGKGVTAKEAYNLLEGRAVHKELSNKEGKSYHAWIQLGFGKKDQTGNHEVKQYHENYNYDLKSTLSKYAITELKEADKTEALLQSLRKGNMQAVTIEKEGMVSKMFVEANPQFKSINLYDGQLRRVPKENLSQYQSVENKQSNEINKEQKQNLGQDKSRKENQGVNKAPDNLKGSKKSKGKSLHH